ncbi:MAG: methyltransferase domain-containing protein [Planctomycetota bacterium]|nr:methyltransferase domain-containing protein [Planctomycetota bacterium]
MDDPALSADELQRALRGLSRLNRVSGVASAMWKLIERELTLAHAQNAASQGQPAGAKGGVPTGDVLTILDAATGSGDVPLAMATLARSRGISVRLNLTDLRPEMLSVAGERARRAGIDATLSTWDVLGGGTPPPAQDVVTCSLFLHHVPQQAIVPALHRLAASARRLLVVVDLFRSPSSYALVALASRLVTRSPVVHQDALLSVRAALTPAELQSAAQHAGLSGARVVPMFPCRMALVWHAGEGVGAKRSRA